MFGYMKIEKDIGYRFRRKRNLETALIHPSYRHENPEVGADNQRLEFLGDAVLDLIVAEHLFRNLDLDEGGMTRLRSNITCTTALAEVARAIDLGASLAFGRGETASNGSGRDSNLADALEAVIGAAYIDGGLRAATRIVRKLFLPMLAVREDIDEQNPKGSLQEQCQKYGYESPEYVVVDESGPPHDKSFLVEVRIAGRCTGSASASSKSKAERAAAKEALRNIDSVLVAQKRP